MDNLVHWLLSVAYVHFGRHEVHGLYFTYLARPIKVSDSIRVGMSDGLTSSMRADPLGIALNVSVLIVGLAVGGGAVWIVLRSRVSVLQRDGHEEWVLVHVEVQSQWEARFARRMYAYNYRLTDMYNKAPVSLAVLGDERPEWRPDRYQQGLWGCSVDFRSPIA